ncbi:MAG TPA: aldo/keto reductase, partial [Burkholderiales bacterium]|nr:aldo/keto reductase [Burkholderiales bacterium]
MSFTKNLTRRRVLAAGAAAAAGGALGPLARLANAAAEAPVMTRPIPRTGEPLPIVGIGTALIFDFDSDPAKLAERKRVIETLIAGGGKLIDTAHSYGRAEDRLGDAVAELGVREKLFLATKFGFRDDRAAATASLQASLRRLKTNRIDLMQAWNVTDAGYDFGLLREWQKQGLCRYVGMTTSQQRQYGVIGKVLAREKPDFFQVNYSLADREAEDSLLPIARDSGAAVIVNLPFGRNSLFRKAGSRPLPDFAAEFEAKTWAQFFLKFILSHPAVTAVIPGTDKPEYMLDNLQAGRGP